MKDWVEDEGTSAICCVSAQAMLSLFAYTCGTTLLR